MRRVALFLCFASALLLSSCGLSPSVVGVWKATDQYGHEHYFEFHKDGSLVWWDRDRDPSHEGGFNERPHFRGTYTREGGKVVATASGFPPQPLGVLTFVSENELKQHGGHAMRDGVVYRRVAGE
jgi:hypothetical protein